MNEASREVTSLVSIGPGGELGRRGVDEFLYGVHDDDVVPGDLVRPVSPICKQASPISVQEARRRGVRPETKLQLSKGFPGGLPIGDLPFADGGHIGNVLLCALHSSVRDTDPFTTRRDRGGSELQTLNGSHFGVPREHIGHIA